MLIRHVVALTPHWHQHLNAAIIALVCALVFIGLGWVFSKSSSGLGCFVFFLGLVAIIALFVQVFNIFSTA